MEVVGIRELRTHLRSHLKRVLSGARLAVSDHGRVSPSSTRPKSPLASTGRFALSLKDEPTGAVASQSAAFDPFGSQPTEPFQTRCWRIADNTR